MKKFTVFTVILSLIVIVVAGEMIVRQYFPSLLAADSNDGEFVFNLPDNLDISKIAETNVLGADSTEDADSGLNNRLGSDIDYNQISDLSYEEIDLLPQDTATMDLVQPVVISEDLPIEDNSVSDVPDFEDEIDYSSSAANIYLREEQVLSAGFADAYLESEPPNGFLFKTIYVDDLYDFNMDKHIVRNTNSLLTKVYVITLGPASAATDVYDVLKVRASQGLDIELNETNEFADGSFYMNDARRTDTAFLIVRFGQLIYGFSYPKIYHAQIKNLITLLDLEF